MEIIKYIDYQADMYDNWEKITGKVRNALTHLLYNYPKSEWAAKVLINFYQWTGNYITAIEHDNLNLVQINSDLINRMEAALTALNQTTNEHDFQNVAKKILHDGIEYQRIKK